MCLDLFRFLELQSLFDLPQTFLQLSLFQAFRVQSLKKSLKLVLVLVVEPLVLGLSKGDIFLTNMEVFFAADAI